MARQRGANVGKGHSWNETPASSERINQFREPIQRTSMVVKSPFADFRVECGRRRDPHWHDPRAIKCVPARSLFDGIFLSRGGVRHQKKLADRNYNDIRAHESE